MSCNMFIDALNGIGSEILSITVYCI